MSYTVSLQQRIQQLKAIKADLPDIMRQVAKDATLRAIEATAAVSYTHLDVYKRQSWQCL